MNHPLVSTKHINEAIREEIEFACLMLVEKMPDVQELLQERTRLVDLVASKLPKTDYEEISDLSDLFVTLFCAAGSEMFKLGLRIGLDPSLALELPDTEEHKLTSPLPERFEKHFI